MLSLDTSRDRVSLKSLCKHFSWTYEKKLRLNFFRVLNRVNIAPRPRGVDEGTYSENFQQMLLLSLSFNCTSTIIGIMFSNAMFEMQFFVAIFRNKQIV